LEEELCYLKIGIKCLGSSAQVWLDTG
jgi:hypothetical protein